MFDRLKKLLGITPAQKNTPELPTYQTTMTRWLVLQTGPNPSTDYYIRPRADASGLPVIYRNIDSDIPQATDFAPGTYVVMVRYLNQNWSRALIQQKVNLAGVVYFMDDDLLDAASWHGLPKHYRKKLRQYCLAMLPKIREIASEYWVSTPALAEKHQAIHAKITPPLLGADHTKNTTTKVVQIFYHGSQSHVAEMHWLRPIIEQVLQACPQAHFEIIGNHEINKLYRNLPRTRILHPMSWPNYLDHCRNLNGHIGLAPLLESSFNAGRSHAKVLDITRCRATGIYSDQHVYARVIQHGHNGLLLPNDPAIWVREICSLVSNITGLAQQ